MCPVMPTRCPRAVRWGPVPGRIPADIATAPRRRYRPLLPDPAMVSIVRPSTNQAVRPCLPCTPRAILVPSPPGRGARAPQGAMIPAYSTARRGRWLPAWKSASFPMQRGFARARADTTITSLADLLRAFGKAARGMARSRPADTGLLRDVLALTMDNLSVTCMVNGSSLSGPTNFASYSTAEPGWTTLHNAALVVEGGLDFPGRQVFCGRQGSRQGSQCLPSRP